MGLFLFILILVLLAAAGILGLVIQVALGVALGIVLAVAVLGALVTWRVRRILRGPKPPRWRRVPGSSSIEVLDRHDPS